MQRTGGRAVEGARLESVYTFIAYRGFESPSVRQNLSFEPAMQRFRHATSPAQCGALCYYLLTATCRSHP